MNLRDGNGVLEREDVGQRLLVCVELHANRADRLSARHERLRRQFQLNFVSISLKWCDEESVVDGFALGRPHVSVEAFAVVQQARRQKEAGRKSVRWMRKGFKMFSYFFRASVIP